MRIIMPLGVVRRGISIFIHQPYCSFFMGQNRNTKPAKMAVFSDGNLAENQLDKGNPLELGYDKWTNNLYANKAFLHNTVHYLMNENERLLLRSKQIRMAFLNPT